MKFEILDTTLRDGEQTSGVAFSAPEKLSIARKLLEEVRVDRIEIASARVSQGEFDCVKRFAIGQSLPVISTKLKFSDLLTMAQVLIGSHKLEER